MSPVQAPGRHAVVDAARGQSQPQQLPAFDAAVLPRRRLGDPPVHAGGVRPTAPAGPPSPQSSSTSVAIQSASSTATIGTPATWTANSATRLVAGPTP